MATASPNGSVAKSRLPVKADSPELDSSSLKFPPSERPQTPESGALNSKSRLPVRVDTPEEDPYNINPQTPSSQPPNPSHDSEIAAYIRASPGQAKIALQSQIADTDRRIRDASKLGTLLLDQKQHLKDRLKELESQQGNEELGEELKQKLVELEKEYNEIGKASARSFIPRPQLLDAKDNSSAIGGDSSMPRTTSSSRVPQFGSRINDVKFAAEISTSLLSQVRHLQGLLHEKDEELKRVNNENAQLIEDADSHGQKMRNLDENEQRYKDENWTLETHVQDLSTQIREAAAREQRLTQTLNAIKTEKSMNDREYDELRQSHGKLTDDHSALRRQHELDISGLRREITEGETEREGLQKKVDEVVSQNQDLAKAVAYRIQSDNETNRESEPEPMDERSMIDMDADGSPPPSPTKAAQRHGGLESETLKSSLHHAHRMIQNLKTNIHREKTEKIELKRMLQDARDEIEERRADGSGATASKRRKQDNSKKPSRADRLGAPKNASEEITNDPSWEDYNGSPHRQVQKGDISDAGNETTDGFETATENMRSPATESEEFMTGAESLPGDTDDDLTETEETQTKSNKFTPRIGRSESYRSTASDDGDAYDLNVTPNQPRYKLKMHRGSRRQLIDTPGTNDSPASFASSITQTGERQNLADELGNLDDGSVASSTLGHMRDFSRESTPGINRQTPPAVNSMMVDSSTTMDTEASTPSKGLLATVGGALFGGAASAGALETLKGKRQANQNGPAEHQSRSMTDDSTTNDLANASTTHEHVPKPRQTLGMSSISAQATEPIIAKIPPQSIQLKTTEPITDTSSTLVSSSVFNEPALAQSLKPFILDFNNAFSSRGQAEIPSTPPVASSKTRDVDASEDFETSSIGRISITPGKDITLKELNAMRRRGSNSSNTSSRANRNVLSAMNDAETQKRNANNWQDSSRLIMNDEEDQENQFREPTLQFSGANDVPEKYRPSSSELASEYLSSRLATRPMNNGPMAPPQTSTPTRSMSSGSGTSPNFSRGQYKTSPAGAPKDRTSSPVDPPLPPLPRDHREAIAAAASRTSSLLNSTMPPPVTPASANRQSTQNQLQNRSSNSNFVQSPLAHKTGSIRQRAPSVVTRRSSVSSFASEIEERFELSNQNRLHHFDGMDVAGADPRMIQAITQTMIGEYLWKYTRKAGRRQHSEHRNKRFFWIHPYTRTLYWSNRDPATAGRLELKAKSVAIEAVRVLDDENPLPPGLHTKSIVVVTPGRSIKFTAPTAQRHETWFNALSYLLLRNEADGTAPPPTLTTRKYTSTTPSISGRRTHSRATSAMDDDTADFIPGGLNGQYGGSSNRLSSMSSTKRKGGSGPYPPDPSQYNSGTSSPRVSVPSLAVRQSQAAQRRAQASNSAPLIGSNNDSPLSTPSRTPRAGDATATAALAAATAAATPSPDSSHRPISSSHTPNAPSIRSNTSRMSSLTSKLRTPSLVSLTRRSRRQSRNDGTDDLTPAAARGDMLPPPKPASAAQVAAAASSHNYTIDQDGSGSIRGRISRQSSRQSRNHSHTREDPNAMENVRACCDGKHDIGSLSHHHHSGSSSANHKSHRSTSSRTQSLTSRVSGFGGSAVRL